MLRYVGYLLIVLIWLCSSALPTGAQVTSTAAAYPQRSDVPLKKIEGTVVNSATGEPIRRALVTLSGAANRACFTDDEGRFVFEQVGTGPLILHGLKPGFFNPHDHGAPIDISKSTEAIELNLVPTSVIHGQIIGANDEPVERIPLQLFESKIVEGRRRWMVVERASSDEDGRFRIADLKPGAYKLAAGPSGGPWAPSLDTYGLTYYPNSPDRNSARNIQLSAGDQPEINFRLRPVRTYKVSGVVTGTMPQHTGIQLFDQSDAPLPLPMRFETATGSFEVFLPAGNYKIRAMSADGKGQMVSVTRSLTVGSNISGLMLPLGKSIDIPVVVRKEFFKEVAAGGQQPASVSVQLVSTADGNTRGFSMPHGPREDGSIVVQNVEPGTYDVELTAQGMSLGAMYVASARCGNTNLLQQPLTVSDDGVDPIEVVLRDDGAMLKGSVRGATSGGEVLIISDTDQKRRMRGGFSPEGRLFTPSLAPGAYTIYAFAHLDQVEYANPEVLRQYQSKAAHVILSGNQTTNITLDLIETEQ